MKKLFAFLLICFTLSLASAQVKPSYLYTTTMPYGTLDLRTTISATNYYYLEEGKTFAYRESSPGVRTNSYFDMTASFDSSPYGQGHLRWKNGASDKFVMNYRMLMPQNYNAAYAEGYPLIVIMHGAGERGNCLYNACYHGTWAYDPNVNSPVAPTTATHKLLNNDHNLNLGGKQHLDARNLAGSRLPNDPAMPARAFPGFVIVPQMFNVWDSLNVQDMVRIVQLHIKKYKIDPNRVYIHGLSIGGYAVYEAIKRAPWLFAAALPMSAVKDGNIFKHNQQAKVVHIPIWTFQGGTDKGPTPAYTEALVNKLNSAGAVVKYTLYPTFGHATWNKAYSEATFFTWILSKNKANIHASKGITVIDLSKNQKPKLMLPEGFFAYQWERNGAIISGTSNIYTATVPGTYRARFSRVAAPTATQWNKWSAPLTITQVAAAATAAKNGTENLMVAEEEEIAFAADVYPNPSSPGDLKVNIQTMVDGPVELRLIDHLGSTKHQVIMESDRLNGETSVGLPSGLSDGMYILRINQGRRQINKKIIVKN